MRIHQPIRRNAAILAALLTVASLGCNEDLQRALAGGAATSGTVLAAISRAQTSGGTVATATPGTQTNGTDANFTLTLVPSTNAVTNGGTASIQLSAPSPFSQVQIGANGLEGYYLITLPAPTTSVTVHPTVDQDYIQPSITFQFSVGDGVTHGPIAEQPFAVIVVGTGDIQVSLTFSQQDDVDLAVVDPNLDVVYFANRTVPSGGTLDLDANPVCGAPHGNSENITWPTGTAIAGTYDVYVTLYQSCFGGPVDYVLTVSVVGSDPFLIQGTLIPPGDEGVDILIASFMVGP